MRDVPTRQSVRAADGVDRWAETPGPTSEVSRPVGPIDARYQIIRHLGDGGSASVYTALDRHLMRSVAVKRYAADASNERAVAQFWREARLTAWLTHPNIVPIYDVLQRGDGGYDLVMQLVEGETFSSRINRADDDPNNPDTLELHLRDLLKVCDAISFAHSRGVVHCDLKPANIMVGAHGEVYVMDWGIARVLPGGPPEGDVATVPSEADLRGSGKPPDDFSERGQDATTLHNTIRHTYSGGTPVYMAPEQADGTTKHVDARTDVFGLGAVLYEILTGFPPYEGTTLFQVLTAAKNRNLIPPDERAPGRTVSPELRRVCLKAMALQKDDRFVDVPAFAAEVREILRGGGWFESKKFAAGEIIVQEGDASDGAFVLKEGTCKVVRGFGGNQKEIRSLGPGDVIGEAGLITGEPRSATVIASSAVEVQVISSRGLKYELAHHGLVGVFLKALATRFLDVDQKLFDSSRQRQTPEE